MAEHQLNESTELRPTFVLTATKVKRCEACLAPGVYTNEDRIKDGWPGCYVADASQHGKPVGSKCPNCGAERPTDEDLGELGRGFF